MVHHPTHAAGARAQTDAGAFGANVANHPNTLRQRADARGVPLGRRGSFDAAPRPLAPPRLQAVQPAKVAIPEPVQAKPAPQRQLAAGQTVGGSERAPAARARTRPEARPVAPVVLQRQARQAAMPPADTSPVVFHRAPSPLPVRIHLPVTSALARSVSVADPQARQAEAIREAGRNAEKARTEAGVDVRKCGFLRKVVTRAPGALLATFDLACAAVATVATFGYANKVLAVAWRNLKESVLDPVATSAQVEGGAPSASDFAAQEPAPKASRAERLVQALQTARTRMKTADEQAQVQTAAYRGFVRRAVVLGAGTIGLGIAIATTVLSGGATLAIPGLVMATLLVRNYLANARCAWANHKAAEQGKPQLPMGSNALNNALYRQYIDEGKCTDAEARLKATKVGGSVSVMIGLALVGTSLTGLIAGSAVARAAKWVCDGMKGTRLVTSATQGVVMPTYETWRGRSDRGEQRALREKMTQEASEAWTEFLSGLGILPANPDVEQAGRQAAGIEGLSRALAVWTTSGQKLEDLPDIMSRDGWLAGVELPKEGQVGSDQSALAQVGHVLRELRLKEEAGAIADSTGAATTAWSAVTWSLALKGFIESFTQA